MAAKVQFDNSGKVLLHTEKVIIDDDCFCCCSECFECYSGSCTGNYPGCPSDECCTPSLLRLTLGGFDANLCTGCYRTGPFIGFPYRLWKTLAVDGTYSLPQGTDALGACYWTTGHLALRTYATSELWDGSFCVAPHSTKTADESWVIFKATVWRQGANWSTSFILYNAWMGADTYILAEAYAVTADRCDQGASGTVVDTCSDTQSTSGGDVTIAICS